MLITERDVEIMKFINDFGYCEMPQLERKFNLRKPRSYKVIRRLIDKELVKHEYMLRNKHGIYCLTKKGAKFTDLPMYKHVSLASYLHQITIVNVYLDLMDRFPDASWLCERKLRRAKFIEAGYRKPKHVADGILILPDGKRIAIEVELTMKKRRRLEKIIYEHQCDFDIQEVWYFCSSFTYGRVKDLLDDTTIKIYQLNDGLIRF